MAKNKKRDPLVVYKMITEFIIEKLKGGLVPWRQPWADALAPQNWESKKPYRGINYFITSMMGFRSPFFLTYNQALKLGGNVKKGAKSIPIVYWNWLTVKGKDESERTVPFIRYYRAFNLEDIEGLNLTDEQIYPKAQSREVKPLKAAEGIVASMANKPKIVTGNAAFYRPSTDTLTMPNREDFTSDEMFYSVFFHELTHSTGHKSRLNRDGVSNCKPFGTADYSKEELVAEMGAAFLSTFSGIEHKTLDTSASYIKSWLRKLEDNPKWVIQAAGQAQKAVDLVLGRKFEERETPPESQLVQAPATTEVKRGKRQRPEVAADVEANIVAQLAALRGETQPPAVEPIAIVEVDENEGEPEYIAPVATPQDQPVAQVPVLHPEQPFVDEPLAPELPGAPREPQQGQLFPVEVTKNPRKTTKAKPQKGTSKSKKSGESLMDKAKKLIKGKQK